MTGSVHQHGGTNRPLRERDCLSRTILVPRLGIQRRRGMFRVGRNNQWYE